MSLRRYYALIAVLYLATVLLGGIGLGQLLYWLLWVW